MTAKTCLILASVSGLLAVVLGAFGAHGLADSRDADGGYLAQKYADVPEKTVAGLTLPASYKYLQDYHTAVRYHMWHALAVLGVGLLMQRQTSRLLSAAAWSFLIGILLFSGGLYILVILGPKFGGIPWGAVVPIGGVLLVTGWCLLGIGISKFASFSSEKM